MNVGDLDRCAISDAIEILTCGRALHRGETSPRGIERQDCRVTWDRHAREVYSYGRHFPLFRFVPRALSGRRDLFVINGDSVRSGGWGNRSRTPDHQFVARELIAATGADSVVIPFSALDGAGIDIDSVRPIHVRPDENWTETREVRTIVEVPRWRRIETYSVACESESLDVIPKRYREEYRALTDTEREDREAREEPAPTWYLTLPRLPDADGRYRWTEPREREIAPDADGMYRWTVEVHRLGDSLFSAVRTERETRAADPFETERETTRETVQLRDSDGRTYCEGNAGPAEDTGARIHAAGPGTGRDTSARLGAGPEGAACIYCGSELRADVTRRRRARYLSSFDSQEWPPLYFLAEVPRGAGATVETALDRLAPRAVHAALARGREVARQGDIFFIATDLTAEDLEPRIIARARLTQWTRDARAKRGEVGFVAPQSAEDRRRELAYARRVWRERFRAAVAGAYWRETDADARDKSRELWRELLERHKHERAAILPIPDALEDLGRRQKREREDLKRETRRDEPRATGAPSTSRGARARVPAPHGRDAYRDRYGANARGAWTAARHVAREHFRPGETAGTSRASSRRERVRRALAIYGTSHSATEVLRTRGGTYVRGTVRHVPELEPGRTGARDHRPLALGDGSRLYLAVRNTVPRASRRNRRRTTAGTMPAEG